VSLVPPARLAAFGSRLVRHTLYVLIVTSLLVAASGTASAQTVRVIVDGASIWSAPSVPSVVLATVKAGTTLEVVAQVGSWYRVRLPGDSTRVGYILVGQGEGAAGGANSPPTSPRSPQPRVVARRSGPPRRAFVSASAGYQPAVLQFDNNVSFTEFVEQGSRTTTYKTRRGALLDVGFGVEARHDLFIAGAISRFNGSSDAKIDEHVPHPFFFNQMRTLKGTAAALPRDEIALHVQAAVLVPITKRVHLVVAAGPSIFKLKQTFVTDVTYIQEYPYDTVTFESALKKLQKKTRVGGNAQVNVTTMVAKHVGVDGFVRFSHASLSFTSSDGSKFAVPAGGLHVGIGLRAEF
jgi:Bacterial SH3 domain